jgi:hypothetical protein
VGVVVVVLDGRARGVVGEGGLGCDLLKGGGGGGIAFLSSSALVIIGTGSSLTAGGSSWFVIV